MFKAKDHFGNELIIPADKLNMDNVIIEVSRDNDNDVEFDIIFDGKYYFFTTDTNNIWYEDRWENYDDEERIKDINDFNYVLSNL